MHVAMYFPSLLLQRVIEKHHCVINTKPIFTWILPSYKALCNDSFLQPLCAALGSRCLFSSVPNLDNICDSNRSCRSQKKALWRPEASQELLQRRTSQTLQHNKCHLQVHAACCYTDLLWLLIDLHHHSILRISFSCFQRSNKRKKNLKWSWFPALASQVSTHRKVCQDFYRWGFWTN